MNPRINVAINGKPFQLLGPNLVPVFVELLVAHNVDLARINVEITQSVLMADKKTNPPIPPHLRDAGLSINLIDFGTGCSAFTYLNRFAFDKLRIDPSLVDRLVAGTVGPIAIAAAMVTRARALGMRTLAAGIETQGSGVPDQKPGLRRAEGIVLLAATIADQLPAAAPHGARRVRFVSAFAGGLAQDSQPGPFGAKAHASLGCSLRRRYNCPHVANASPDC